MKELNRVFSQYEVNEEYAKGSLRGIIGLLPLGTWLNEMFFNAVARLHQKRINEFVEEFAKDLENVNSQILNQDYLSSEEFYDFVYSIIKKVAVTRNQDKKDKFRKLLIQQIENPIVSDHIEVFIELLSRIEEAEIVILEEVRIRSSTLNGLHSKVFRLETERKKIKNIMQKESDLSSKGYANNLPSVMKSLEEKDKELTEVNDQIFYADKEFNQIRLQYGNERVIFYLATLASKGLLIKKPVPKGNSIIGFENIYVITNYGKNFLEFIREENNNVTL